MLPHALTEPVVSPDPPAPRSIFSLVVGAAGTGKTTLVRGWADSSPQAALCATTGIAAINLGGTTINSLLGYYDTKSLQDLYKNEKLHNRLRKNRSAGIFWYLLDEISMLSGDQLTTLVQAIEEVNRPTSYELYAKKNYKPIRLTLIGDFAQLPPINEKFAFESEEWSRFADNQTLLTTIRRQADRDFIEALQAVRRGDGKRALQYFGDRFEPAPVMTFEGTTLKARNDDVDHFNDVRLEELEGKAVTFVKKQTGEPRGEWRQVPAHLQLKIGALVMVLANKRYPPAIEFEYVNGDLGHLVDAFESTAYIRLIRTGEVVQVEPVTRDHQKPLDDERRATLLATGQGDAIKDGNEIVGAVTYTPLRAAYASTTHKAQGLSLDRVQVDIRNHFFTHPGMLYVALSRARSPEGLRLVGTPRHFEKRCTVDRRVEPWL